MNCFFCKGTMSESTATYVVDLKHCIIIIRNVPCMKCEQCGEVVYTGSIVKQLEKIVDEVQNAMTEVVIINYSDKIVA